MINRTAPLSPCLLILSQVYVPDTPSVGQHMHDAAAEMARRGWRVTVLTSGRGYDDPTIKFPPHEERDGVRIIRLPWSSFGKKTIAIRLLGQMIFLFQCIVRGWLMRHDAILVSTSPPMCSFAALMIHAVRRKPIQFWAMDINPDQAVTLGKFRATSLPARLFNALNHRLLKQSANVVALDRFMAERLERKEPVGSRMTILPPWPHEDHLEPLAHADNPFRAKHQLQGKLVFMYSGNMSIASPLTTILQAALRVRDDPRIHFMFIGGGLGKREVEQVIDEHHPANITCLPYQPLADLRYSLSAADVHLVTLGDDMVGIIHPCKIYGAMSVARPVFFVGPSPSHLADILDNHDIGWHVNHGEVDQAVRIIRDIAQMSEAQLAAKGNRARQLVSEQFSKAWLCGQFCDVLEKNPAAARA